MGRCYSQLFERLNIFLKRSASETRCCVHFQYIVGVTTFVPDNVNSTKVETQCFDSSNCLEVCLFRKFHSLSGIDKSTTQVPHLPVHFFIWHFPLTSLPLNVNHLAHEYMHSVFFFLLYILDIQRSFRHLLLASIDNFNAFPTVSVQLVSEDNINTPSRSLSSVLCEARNTHPILSHSLEG